MPQRSRRSIESVDTTLQIVEYLVENGPSRLSDVADAIGKSASTTHTHLNTLREHEYIIQDGSRYRLGLNFLRVGGRSRKRLEMFKAGRQEIDRLANELQQACHLALEQSGKQVIVYKSEFGDAVHYTTATGEFSHMHWSAAGKAILAHMPEARIRSIIEQHGLPRATPATYTDKEELLSHLAEIRNRGYAVEREERCPGVVAIGVPIFDVLDDTVVASVSVSGPRGRLLDSDGEILHDPLTRLQDCAHAIERRYHRYARDFAVH